MDSLTHSLERTVAIQASPETVFRFFTDSERWARWWGAGSSIEARPGGAVKIRYPNGIEASGEVLELESPRRIVFTYGYESGKPIPPGASRVTILIEPSARGTSLKLTHEFADASVRDQHVQGWRFQLSLFTNAVADEVNAGAEAKVDAWFAAWFIGSEEERRQALTRIAAPQASFGDPYSALEGIDEISAHIGASQRFMPSVRLERRGAVRHCQGVALADWAAVAPDGQERASGTNVFGFGPHGLLEWVKGFWNAAAGKSA
jgi:uncharacterized protein YndB with AHSA1/START domain